MLWAKVKQACYFIRPTTIRRFSVYFLHIEIDHFLFNANSYSITTLTFITISDGEEVDVIRVAVEEKQRDPAVAAVDGHDEQDAHDPSLLRRVRVPAQVLVNLQWRLIRINRLISSKTQAQ